MGPVVLITDDAAWLMIDELVVLIKLLAAVVKTDMGLELLLLPLLLEIALFLLVIMETTPLL